MVIAAANPRVYIALIAKLTILNKRVRDRRGRSVPLRSNLG
jgi:hypothetical protein